MSINCVAIHNDSYKTVTLEKTYNSGNRNCLFLEEKIKNSPIAIHYELKNIQKLT